MRNAGLKKHKLESRLLGEMSITSDMQMTPPLWQKTKIMASGPITSWQIDGETVETVVDFILGGFKITANQHMMIAAMKLKDACSLEGKL